MISWRTGFEGLLEGFGLFDGGWVEAGRWVGFDRQVAFISSVGQALKNVCRRHREGLWDVSCVIGLHAELVGSGLSCKYQSVSILRVHKQLGLHVFRGRRRCHRCCRCYCGLAGSVVLFADVVLRVVCSRDAQRPFPRRRCHHRWRSLAGYNSASVCGLRQADVFCRFWFLGVEGVRSAVIHSTLQDLEPASKPSWCRSGSSRRLKTVKRTRMIRIDMDHCGGGGGGVDSFLVLCSGFVERISSVLGSVGLPSSVLSSVERYVVAVRRIGRDRCLGEVFSVQGGAQAAAR